MDDRRRARKARPPTQARRQHENAGAPAERGATSGADAVKRLRPCPRHDSRAPSWSLLPDDIFVTPYGVVAIFPQGGAVQYKTVDELLLDLGLDAEELEEVPLSKRGRADPTTGDR